MRREASLLWLGAALVTVGGILAVAGSRAAWAIVTTPGRTVEVDGRSVTFPAQEQVLRVDDVAGGGTTAWAAALVLLSLALFLVGPRVRFGVAIAAIVAAGAIVFGLSDATVEVVPPAVAGSGSGRTLVVGGGVLGLTGALAVLPLALKVPRVRMPERAPDLDVSAPER